MVAIVPGNVNTTVSSGKKQPAALRIFANHTNHFTLWEAIHNFFPGLSEIVSSRHVRRRRFAGAPDRQIGSGWVVMGRLDIQDLRRFGQSRRRHILPGRARIARDIDQAMAGASPDFAGLQAGWR